MKYILLVVLIISNLFSVNSNEFELRQERLVLIKQVIQDEESIAKAYEEFLINELNRPSSIADLINNIYLGTAFSSSFSGTNATYFNNYTIPSNSHSINYRLKDLLKNDNNLRRVYDSNIYRKHTFVHNDRVYIILDNNFAKNLIPLLDELGGTGILDCSDVTKRKYCIKNNHMYIYETDTRADLMMYYYLDSFETGPIIINDDVAYHDKDEFKYLTPGAKLIDFKNQKYLKTYDDIRKLQ